MPDYNYSESALIEQPAIELFQSMATPIKTVSTKSSAKKALSAEKEIVGVRHQN